jgi:RNA polymerase sigma factor (sigma-70 family)
MTAPSRLDESAEMRLSRGDPGRFAAIFDAHFAEIHRYVVSRLGASAAEDVVAETFLAAFRGRSQYDPKCGSVRTWLYGIATNLVGKQRRVELRALRAMGRRGPDPHAEGPEERVVSSVAAQRLRPELAAAIASLNAADREVLLLVALGGLSHEEVAAALDIPYGTVGSRLSRARKKIRAVLGDTNPLHDVSVERHDNG